MANVLEVDSSMLIQKAAEKLAEAKVSKPQYVDFVKSGAGKERTPQDQMFWYIRGGRTGKKHQGSAKDSYII